MSKQLTISSIGTKGLNTDVAPWDLPPEFINFGYNFKVQENSILTTGGYLDWSTDPVPFNPGFLMHVGATSGSYWLVAGRTAIHAFDGATWTDVSSTIGYASLGIDDELLWNGCMLGNIPIVNNPQASPEYWSPQSPGQIMKPLPWDAIETWAERGVVAKVIRSHKTFLFALNVRDGAVEQRDTYRWSTSADINGLPYTWDETDESGLAGVASLGGDGGEIIDGLGLRDSFVIYSERAIDILDFTGGEFVWKRRELSDTVGLISKDCVVEVKGVHYIMSDGDILRNDGTTLTSIVHGRIKRQYNAAINPDVFERCFAIRNIVNKEIWFCVPEEGFDYPNKAFVYNWTDESWTIRGLPDNLAFAALGPQSEPAESWEQWTGNWETQTRVWGSRRRTPLDASFIGIDTSSKAMLLEPDDSRDSGPLESRVERTDLPLEGFAGVTTITRVYPHMEGTSPVQFQFGSQNRAGGPVTWKPPITFIPGQERKIDIRSTGSLHAWRLQSLADGNWKFSGMDLEYEEAGFR